MESNPEAQRKVNFLVIGAQKSGTSALDKYLRLHPEIEMAKTKEVHFFDNEVVFSKNNIDYSLLEKQFEWKTGAKYYGEVTPIYLYWEPSMKRIWEYNRDMKLIAILRNPVERAFSHWTMESGRGLEQKDFLHCILNENERLKEALPFQHRIYSYVDRGFYAHQIRRVWRYFPQGQVMFIKYEDYLQNQEATLTQLFSFLNVAHSGFRFSQCNTMITSYKREINEAEKELLLGIYRNEINEVEQLLNWDCTDWKK